MATTRRRRRAAVLAGLGCYPGGRPRLDDDVDEVAVERAMYGDTRVTLNALERAAAVQLLTGRGYSALEIAQRLRISPRTVARHRAASRRHRYRELAA